MTTQEIIQLILLKHPELSQEKIMENLDAEKKRAGGLLGEETLLRLIAAKFGVEVPYNRVFSQILSTKNLHAGLNDVTVEGGLLAVFASKTFQGEKSGKYATLLVADNDGVLRVVLWNDKADMVDSGELKANQTVRLCHGYTREDRYGKTELHLGTKSQIQIQPNQNNQYPTVEKFTVKINQLNKACQIVRIAGTVKEVFGLTRFARSDQTDGFVMRFVLADDSGKIIVVAWNERAQELEKTLKINSELQLINAKVKENPNGGLEVHVDSNVLVDFVDSGKA